MKTNLIPFMIEDFSGTGNITMSITTNKNGL